MTKTINKEYIDYAKAGDLMVMVSSYLEKSEDTWHFWIDPTDYKLRKITIIEKAKNSIILMLL